MTKEETSDHSIHKETQEQTILLDNKSYVLHGRDCLSKEYEQRQLRDPCLGGPVSGHDDLQGES